MPDTTPHCPTCHAPIVKKLEDALKAGDKAAATEAFKGAQPEIMRAAQKGVIHKNTASRKVSRLSKAIKAMTA